MIFILLLHAFLLCLNLHFGFCEEGFFWHLTDLHYDPWYQTKQESCWENLQNPGKYGNFECDAPWELVHASVKAMKNIEGGGNADFILWSGDNAAHAKNLSLLNTEMVLEITQNITDIIVKEFPDTLVVPVIGNHDYFPKHQLPGENNTLYNGLADMWSDWLDTADTQDTFRQGAYFTSTLSESPKVRAVILNTNLYLKYNKVTQGQEDPGGQFAWLESVMNKSRYNGEKVYMFYHVPLGKVYGLGGSYGPLATAQNARLLDIFSSYADIILGMFSAHVHQDTFKIFYNKMGEAVSAMFIPASVTPWKARVGDRIGRPHNPALRRYTFDKTTYELIDVQQYYLDLKMANSLLKAEWNFLYSFRETYDLHNISAGELHRLLQEIKKPNSGKFDTFFDLNTVHTRVEGEEERKCSCECKSIYLCSIEYVDYEEFDECYKKKMACQQNDKTATNKANALQYQEFVPTVIYCGILVLLKLFL